MFKSFDDWSRAGYKIKKGSKAVWINNTAMFSEQQVTKNVVKPSSRPMSTFRHCTPKGTSELWDLDNDDDIDNPLTHDWLGRRY